MQTDLNQPPAERWQTRFFIIWGGQAFSLLGSMLVGFALIWWLTRTTGSAVALATASLAGMLPQVFLGPLAGALVDRWNRRLVMIVADSLVALATLALALLFWSGWIEIWHVYLMLFLRSAAGAFHWPAMSASTSLMVPKEHLTRIQGLNSMLNGGMNIAAAPLGALMLELLPLQGVLFVDVITALLAITPLLFFSVPQPQKTIQPDADGQPAARPSVWEDMQAGLRYVITWPALLIILGMALLINFLLTPATSLIPLLVKNHFSGQAFQFAWMEAGWGIGAIAGGLLLGVWGGFKNRIYTSLAGLVGLGLASLMIGFAPASAYLLALAAMFILGVMNPIVNGPLMAIIQSNVAPEMQGRVFTLIGAAASAMSPLGLLLAGPAADRFGVQSWFIIGGVATALMGFSGFLIPALARLESHPNATPAPLAEPVLEEVRVNA